MSFNSEFVNSTIVCNEKKEVDLDALNLTASGEADSLCRCSYRNENGHHHFIYSTDSYIPLTQLQAGLSFENTVDILSSACEMIKFLSAHHLFLDNVKLAKEYVFRAENGYKFIYIPIVQKPRFSNKDFLVKLVSVIRHKDARLEKFVKEIRKMKDNEQALAYLAAFVFSYNSQNDALYSYETDEADETDEAGATTLLCGEGETTLLGGEAAVMPSGTEQNVSENETALLSDFSEFPEFPEFSDFSDSSKLSDFPDFYDNGDTSATDRTNYDIGDSALNTDSDFSKSTEYYRDESGESETTVLTPQPAPEGQVSNLRESSEYCLYLIRNLNGEKVTIDVTPFTIGKDSANMDFVLNNDSVSRHHATVIYENGNYFIMDNHSTNGTMIEGIRLQPGEKGEIENGYIISLGNESFQAHTERRE